MSLVGKVAAIKSGLGYDGCWGIVLTENTDDDEYTVAFGAFGEPDSHHALPIFCRRDFTVSRSKVQPEPVTQAQTQFANWAQQKEKALTYLLPPKYLETDNAIIHGDFVALRFKSRGGDYDRRVYYWVLHKVHWITGHYRDQYQKADAIQILRNKYNAVGFSETIKYQYDKYCFIIIDKFVVEGFYSQPQAVGLLHDLNNKR